MKKTFFIIFSLAALVSKAQIVSYDFYTFRLNNMFNVNPAYAGKDDGLNIILGAQSQNKGVAFNNKNLIIGAYSKISGKQAIGGKMISDTRGAFQTLKADLSYAYIAKITAESKLLMGLSAGILNNNLIVNRIENYQALDQTDPTLTQPSNNSTQFAAGAGILYNYKTLEVSVSLPHILTTNQPTNSYLNTAMFYTIKAKEKFKLTPWICYQNIPTTENIFSGHLKAMYNDMIWVQVGYQTNQTFNSGLGIHIENLSLIYGFRFSNKQFADVTSGSHEVTLSYKIAKRNKTSASTAVPEAANGNTNLNDIISHLDNLLNGKVTDKEKFNTELETIKRQLQSVEMDNSTPEKAQEVEKQLKEIDEKLKLIEKKFSNE